MILDEETFTPLSKLSRAFLSPASSDHLMFAYYESAQAVAWLVETYGEQKFQRVLKDLAEGRRINEALSRHTAPAEEVDTAFSAHLQAKARALASEADWEKPEAETVDPRDPKAVLAYLKENPKNLWALRTACSRLLAAEQWSEALAMAQRLSALFPDDPDASNGYFLAAQAYRGLKQPNEESASLRQWLRRSADAAPASLRLMELDAQSKNWAGLREAAQRMLAIDPFLKRPHEALAEASEAQGDKESATTALKHLLTLGPDNPVQVNYSLARLLQEKDVKAARRHVLDALAEAPRFRAGHELLLQLQSPPP
jgi:predicted Zn-dependent protease